MHGANCVIPNTKMCHKSENMYNRQVGINTPANVLYLMDLVAFYQLTGDEMLSINNEMHKIPQS